MQNVHVVETKTGRVRASIPINMGSQNYTPTRQQCEAEAWAAAVSDRSVDPKRRADYSFEIEDVPPPAAPKAWA